MQSFLEGLWHKVPKWKPGEFNYWTKRVGWVVTTKVAASGASQQVGRARTTVLREKTDGVPAMMILEAMLDLDPGVDREGGLEVAPGLEVDEAEVRQKSTRLLQLN